MEPDLEMQQLMALYEPIIGRKPRVSHDFAEVDKCLRAGEKGIIIKYPGEPRAIVILSIDPSGEIRYADAGADAPPPDGFSMSADQLKSLMESGATALL